MELGRYELLAPIGAGGMAHVWAARQRAALGFTRIVAIKVIRPDYASDPDFRAMFLEEARLAARLRHTNVVEVLDLGEHEETLFQVMPLIEGASLSRITAAAAERRGRAALPIGVAARILCDVLRGLEAAHELEDDEGRPQMVIHRDVSPQNILVGVDGVAKIADFGIAKAIGQGEVKTQPGVHKGKLGYMAPELLADGFCSRESDVFAAGVVLWEAWAGTRLFPRDGRDRQSDPVARLDGVPAPLRAVLQRALADDPRRRYPSAGHMVGELEHAARAAGVLATHSDVSEIIESAVGEHVALVRASLRGTRPAPDIASLATIASTVVFTTVPPPPPDTRPRHAPRLAALAVLAALGAVAFLGARSNAGAAEEASAGSARAAAAAEPASTNVRSTAAPATAVTDRGAPSAPFVAQPALPQRATATSTSTSTSTSTPASNAAAPRARAGTARAAPRPAPEVPARKSATPAEAPRPPFESPYE
jgi:serine/threonine protein kinase